MISADLSPHCADAVLDKLHESNVSDEHYVMVRQEIVAPQREAGSTLQTDQDFAWVEVLGSARANSRPIGRYMLLMLASGAIAAMGVTSGNSILIVGAMAVSPDLLPICATFASPWSPSAWALLSGLSQSSWSACRLRCSSPWSLPSCSS